MSQFPEITSNLSTANFRASILTLASQIASGGSSGGTGNVIIIGSLPSGSNSIGYLTQPNSFASGQQAVTASASPLPSATLVNGVVLTNGSSATVYIGGSGVTTSTGYALAVGSSVGLGVANLSSVYIIGTASSGNLSYIGS